MYKDQIQKILDDLGYEYESDYHNGLANLIIKAKKDNQDFILKFYTRDYFKKDREENFIKLVAGHLPTPQVIESGNNFLIFQYMAGISGADIFAQQENVSQSMAIGKLVGQAVKQLHSRKVEGKYIGFLANDFLSAKEYSLEKSKYESNQKFLQDLIIEQIEHLKKYDVDIPDFTNLEINIKHDRERRLIHHDLDVKNINFKDGGISSFFDFEYAMIGHPYFDLAKVHVLGIYLAYHTLGKAKYLDFAKYITGFYEAYSQKPTYEELKPFYIYVLLNYILFWLSNPVVRQADMDKILPVHLENLQRLKNNQEIIVERY